MSTINFVASGLLGDFIHSLSACKNICLQHQVKANLYISDGFLGEKFRFGVGQAYADTYELISQQDYINTYQILPDGFSESFVNLNQWRIEVHNTYANTGKYNKCWSELLAQTFNYPISDYPWISVNSVDSNTIGRVVIHRSRKRHNDAHQAFIESIPEKAIFLSTDRSEYENYEFKDLVEPYIVRNVTDLAAAIGSSKLFIGNQSSPLALASAIDHRRVAELCPVDAAVFYLGEARYSKNIRFMVRGSVEHSDSNLTRSSVPVSVDIQSDQFDANDSFTLNNAFSLHQAGKLEESENIYRYLLKKQPSDFVLLHMLGVLRSQAGDLTEAEDLIQKAISVNRLTPEAYYNLGTVYAAQRRATSARACYLYALRLNKNYDIARQQLARPKLW